jgi:Concanavalin A-like lectin/glucanases superfamily/F5/8 type C domain
LIISNIFQSYNGKNFYKLFFLTFCWVALLITSTSQFGSDFINKVSAQSCSNNLPISGVTASGNDGNVPSNVIDNNLNTRWSNLGVGSWIRADLGSTKSICSVDIAWYLGNQRTSNFVIATSTDGTTFTNVFSGTSSGTTLNSEKYTFSSTNARYVRVTVNGNSQNSWASITELDIFGISSISSADYNYAPGFTLTGSNYFDVASTPSLQLSQFSVAAWFKTSTNFGTDAFIVNKGGFGSSTPGQNINYGIWMNSAEQVKAGFETSSNAGHFVTSPNTYNNNQWHYAVVTYDGSSSLKLYVDGVQVASKSTSGATPDSSGTKPVRVGANSRVTPPTSNFFTGEVDEVRVWNDDLTATEVSNAYAGTSFNTGEQVLYLSFTSSGAGTDIFGIKKLYPTKSGGEQWFMNMNNPLGDSRFNPQNTITKNPDGSWKMKSTQVRMAVYTSTGYDQDDIPTLDHSDIAAKGYMLAPNDWRNFEMTQYVKVNTFPSDDNFSPNGRGGRHTGSGAPEGCEGSSMKGDVFFSGKVRFAKEQWHVSYVFTSLKTATSSIEDKWVGIKFVVYNFQENGKTVVKTQLWLDTNNNGNFVKVDENVDRGSWGTEGGECGGAPDQIISWGGPITTFRWDTATDVDFKYLSVREIVPPQ